MRRVARRSLPVREVFGPVFQGEGPHVGRYCCFIRLGRCNLSCAACDTPETWDSVRYDVAALCPEMDAVEIARQAWDLVGERMKVISGGEPLLWQVTRGWRVLLEQLSGPVHVETNGTIVPTAECREAVAHFTVSPKLSALGTDAEERRIKPLALLQFAELAGQGRAAFKFVCRDQADVREVAGLCRKYFIDPSWVWIMPLGASYEEAHQCGKLLSGPTLDSGFNFTPRLHLMLRMR